MSPMERLREIKLYVDAWASGEEKPAKALHEIYKLTKNMEGE